MTSVQVIAATALSLALLGACSKPASQASTEPPASGATAASDASNAPANAADSTANGMASAQSGGGTVSPPQANGAINSDSNKGSADVASASNSFTQSQAKGHIENAGYTGVSNLMKTPDGMWTAKAMKGGKSVDVAIDFKGAVSAK